MPHLILEVPKELYDNQESDKLFHECAQVLIHTLAAKLESCKSRVYVYENGSVLSDTSVKPVTMTIKLLKGRTLEAKQQAGQEIKQIIERYFTNHRVSVTVEICELSDVYIK